MSGSMRKGRGPVAALLLQFFAAMLLLCSGSAFAQVMTFTGASPTTFSAAGQTITFTVTYGQDNAVTHSLTLNNMSVAPAPVSALSCPGGNLQPNNTWICTFTYVTTTTDIALGQVDMFGSFTAAPPSGTPTRSGAISNHQKVPYVAAAQPAVANPVSATVAYNSSNNAITLNITGGAPASVAIGTAAAHGLATASGTSITYTPNSGYSGPDSFTYTATNASGTSAPATVSITVGPPPVPTVTSISPTAGPTAGGTTVVITGSGFNTVAASGGVKFGATAATYTINSNTQITATSPGHAAGTVDVTVTNAGGASTTSAADQYTYVAAPTVTSISPTSGPTTGGTTVTLTGTGFTGATFVTWGGVAGTILSVTSTSITATSPANSGTVDVRVTTAGGTSATSAADQFTYTNPPTANPVSATVAHGSTNNPITLNITGGAPSSVAVGTSPAHGTAVASGTSITYTPTAGYGGPDSFTYTATNASGTSAPATVTITVSNATISYAPASPPSPKVGVAYSQSLAGATGGTAPYSYAVTSGALPTGLTLQANGTLSGTPTSGGSFTFSVTATDSSTGTGPFSSAPRSITVTVTAATIALSPASGALPAATFGTAYSQTIMASGGTTSYSFAITSGALPAGLSLSAGGTLSGTPTQAGTFNFTVTATDSSGGAGPYTGSSPYSLTVAAPTITLSPVSLSNGSAGTAYTQTISASGGTVPYSYSLSAGSLPVGLSLNTVTGVISGTPSAAGTYNFTMTATDANGFTGSRGYTVTMGGPNFTLAPPTLSATVGQAYTGSFVAGGGNAPYTYSLSGGALPTGITLANDGTLSGTPTAGGVFNFTVTARDSTTGAGAPYGVASNYNFVVAAPTLSMSPAAGALPGGTALTAYSQNFVATGGTPGYTYAISAGALPAGMTLSNTGVLSGTPTAAGTFNFSVRATDNSTGTGAPYSVVQSYSVTMAAPAITIAPSTLPGATGGVAYNQAITASGGNGTFTYSLSAGALPPGVGLTSGGVLSGTPVTAGSFTFTVTATDGFGFTGSQAYTLAVNAPAITIAPATLPGATVAAAYSQAIIANGGNGGYTYALSAGALPAGVALSSGGVLSGTPTNAGSYTFTIKATDGFGFTGSQAYTLPVAAAAQAITGFQANPAAPVFAPNGTFTVSATGGASTSPVVFASASTSVCTVSGSTVTMHSAGTCALTADQAADANYTAAPQVALNVAISAATQAITNFKANPAAPVFAPNGTFTVSATGGASTSPVVFASTTPTICSITGSTVTMLGAGNCALTANQAADANYSAAPQVALNVTITAAGQSVTNFKANPTAPVFAPNGTFAVSATGGASTSPVVFASTTPAICSVSGSTVTMLGAGSCALTANQAGDANYTAAPQVALNVTITAAAQVITNFKANPVAPVFAPNGTFTVSATAGASTSPVVFASTTAAICTVSGSTVTMKAAGVCALTANQAADANYTAAPQVALNVTIAPAGPVISWVTAIHKTQGESAFDLPVPTSTSPGAFTFTSSNTSVATVNGRTVTIVGSGTATITATQAATANYTAGSASATLTVDARPDPTKDPSVTAGLQAQVDASLRYASAQESNVQDRLRQLRSEKGTPAHNGLTLSVGGGRYGQGMSLPLGLGAAGGAAAINGGWMGGNITYGARNGTLARQGYDLRSDGVSFGIDHAFGDYVFGAALGSGWGTAEFADGRSKQDSRHRALTLYGLWRGNEHWYAEGLFGLGQLDFDLVRWSTTANAAAAASRKGDQQYGAFSVGYTQRSDNSELTGYGRVEGNRTTLDAYREHGLGIYDLAYRSQRIETSQVAVGVEASYHGMLGRHAIRPFWSLEYRNALSNNESAALNYAVLPQASDYLIALRGYSDRTMVLGGGFDLELARGWQMSFSYRREQANGVYDNVFGIRVVFGQGGGAPMLMMTPAQYRGGEVYPQPRQQP